MSHYCRECFREFKIERLESECGIHGGKDKCRRRAGEMGIELAQFIVEGRTDGRLYQAVTSIREIVKKAQAVLDALEGK